MSEISKLYENAGIEQRCNIYPTIYDCAKYPHEKCEDCVEWEYPPFTAEKQIAILQLLTQRCDLTISHFTEWEFIHFDGQEPTQVTGKDFTETFAKLINAYWQDLTEEDKTSIKNILEM